MRVGRANSPPSAFVPLVNVKSPAYETPARDPAAGSSPEHGVTLSAFLSPLIDAARLLSEQWVCAEVSEVKATTHVYLTLVETDETGTVVAQVRASLWASSKDSVLAKFVRGTGGASLGRGMKVLVRLKASHHPIYGAGATVTDIDPTYTLGDAQRRQQEVRARLISEGLYDCNRELSRPNDFTRVLVISPEKAAGLGDFKACAERLQEVGLCTFRYFTATFQGIGASESILGALRFALIDHARERADAIVIIRGGGAQTDLAWLNDYELCAALAKAPLPLLTGIGHERDQTLPDEIACGRFDTPSKVIGYIRDRIIAGAQQADADHTALGLSAIAQIERAQRAADEHRMLVERSAIASMDAAQRQVERSLEGLRATSQRALASAEAQASGEILRIKDSACRALDRSADRVKAAIAVVVGASPARTIDRGYAVVRNADDGSLVRSIHQVAPGQKLALIVSDGMIRVGVAATAAIGQEHEEARPLQSSVEVH